MPQKKFIRTDFRKYSKLGVRRKNKQKYRKGKGIDNKMRLNMKGRLRKVKSGFRTAKKTRDLVNGLKPIAVNNIKDLKKVKQGMIGIIAKIGDKKRKAILNYSVKNNIKINLNAVKELAKIENKLIQKKKKKEERNQKKISRDKKVQKESKKKIKEEAKKEDEEKKTEKNKENKVETKSEAKTNNSKQKDILTNNYGRGK